MTGTDRSLTVFVPAYNEVGNLERAVEMVLAAAAPLARCEVIVVDDASTDGTGPLADRLAERHPAVRVIHHGTNRGLAAGYRSALAQARLPYFAMVSGDGEDTLASVERLFAAVGSAEIVVPRIENPWHRGWLRHLVTSVSSAMMNVLFGLKFQHYSGQAVYPTALARSLQTTTQGSFFLAEMLVRAARQGHRFVEVDMRHQPRAYGRSHALTPRNVLRALRIVIGLWLELRREPRTRPLAANPREP